MPKFTIVNSLNDIAIPEGWKKAKYTNRQVYYQGRSYEIIAKIERPLTSQERAVRFLFAATATIFSLGIALLSKTVRDSFTKQVESIRFAIKVEKPGAPTPRPLETDPLSRNVASTSPIAFENYGNSCWFAAAMQILLANPAFEQIVRSPLKEEALVRIKRSPEDSSIGVAQYRRLSQEELEKSRKIQMALIALLDRIQEKDSAQVREALSHLHNTILSHKRTEIPFPARGQMADAATAINFLSKVFGFEYCCFQGIKNKDILHTWSTKRHEGVQLKLSTQDKMPNLIAFSSTHPVGREELPETIDIDKTIDFSKYAKNGAKADYRIVGLAVHIPGHWYSYVRLNDDWYCCNHGIATKCDKKTIDLKLIDQITLQRIDMPD